MGEKLKKIQLVLFTSKCMRPTTYTHTYTSFPPTIGMPKHTRTPLYITHTTHTFTHAFHVKMDRRNTHTRDPSSMGSRNIHTYTTVHHTHTHNTLSLYTGLFLIQTTSILTYTFHTHTLPTQRG